MQLTYLVAISGTILMHSALADTCWQDTGPHAAFACVEKRITDLTTANQTLQAALTTTTTQVTTANTDLQVLEQQLTATQTTITELTKRLEILEAATKLEQFKLDGDQNSFYPVFFADNCYDRGNTRLTITRHVHEDYAWKGGLVASITYRSHYWGSGADYAERLITFSRQPFVADVDVDSIRPGVTFWLRGNTTYHYTTNCPTTPSYNLDGDLVIMEHPALSGGKKIQSKRTDVNPTLQTGWVFSHDLHYPNQVLTK